PETEIQWQTNNLDDSGKLIADRTLLPALTSIIVNACDAAVDTSDPKVTVYSEVFNSQWRIKVVNRSNSLSEQTIKEL
ncbi:hypothetical protein R0K04_29865, partial [Pseudoalteromonas sp. SIMBA_153]